MQLLWDNVSKGVVRLNRYGVIMAGGGGTRFWPLSRQTMPKQLLNLSGNGLMINETIDRISHFITKDNIFIVTNERQGTTMKKSVDPGILENHILMEPAARNTSACIGYAAIELIKKYGDGIMCIFPSDHYIKNVEVFDETLERAIKVAKEEDKLVTVGIKPTFASTGYGYINYLKTEEEQAYLVNEFVEKPNKRMAQTYLEQKNYAWNSGMFVWKASTILKNFERYLPRVYRKLRMIYEALDTPEEEQVLKEIYPSIQSISIDYGIMERSDDVMVLLGEFGWNDVGSWDTLSALYEKDSNGNVIKGEQINLDTKNCICYAKNRLVATIGVENLIIVETNDAILVCEKSQAQEVKKVVQTLVEQGKVEYIL